MIIIISTNGGVSMKHVFCLFLTLITFISGTVVSAQEPELPDPGITPDSWMYGFKRAFEAISMVFTFNEVAKAEKHLHYAELRLSEARAMAEKGKPEYIDNLIKDYEKELEAANKIASLAREVSTKEKLAELVAIATSQHLQILDKVQEQVPEHAKDKISAARERSIKGNQEALKVLATTNPEKAAEIAMNVAEGRINKAKQAAEKGDAEEAAEAAEEYEKYAQFGEEIAAIAQQTGKDPSKVYEIVEKATSIHLTVLEDVLQKVPEQAKTAIQSVIEVSKVVRESAIKALEERGLSVPSLPIPEGEEVKEGRNKTKELPGVISGINETEIPPTPETNETLPEPKQPEIPETGREGGSQLP